MRGGSCRLAAGSTSADRLRNQKQKADPLLCGMTTIFESATTFVVILEENLLRLAKPLCGVGAAIVRRTLFAAGSYVTRACVTQTLLGERNLVRRIAVDA